MTAQEFINAHNNKGVDIDGYYGYQCMDLYLAYEKEVVGCPIQGAPTAKAVWNSYPTAYFDRISNSVTAVPKLGDVVIWGMGDFGHIAIATGVGNTDTFQTLDQNWPWGTVPNWHTAQLVTHDYNNVLGWLRPKVQQVTQGGSEMDEVWKYINEHRDRLYALEAGQVTIKKAISDLNTNVLALTKAMTENNAIDASQATQITKAVNDATTALNRPTGASKTLVELIKEFFSNLK